MRRELMIVADTDAPQPTLAALNLYIAEHAPATDRIDGRRISRPCAIAEPAIDIESCPAGNDNFGIGFGDMGGAGQLVNQLRGECLNRGLERDAVDNTGGAVGVGQRPAGISGITVFIAPEQIWRDGNFKTAAEKPSMGFIRRSGERCRYQSIGFDHMGAAKARTAVAAIRVTEHRWVDQPTQPRS